MVSLAGIRLTSGATTDQQEANALGFHRDAVAVYNTSWGPVDDGLAWIGERLAALAAGKGIPLFAFAGDRYIGSAVIELGSLVATHIGYFGIGLASDFRDQGVGSALMHAVIDEAERYLAGMRMIQLDVFASNERGIHLYRKMGFTEYARLPGAVHHRGNYVDMISMYRPVNRNQTP